MDEGIADDEVGGRTDERQHAAHTASEGQGHEKTRRLQAGGSRHADNNGEHQGHGAGVADKGTDASGGEHKEHKKAGFARAGQTQNAAAHHFGETGGEYTAANNEEAHHHDDDGVGKARKGFFGRQYACQHQGDGGTNGNEVGTDGT